MCVVHGFFLWAMPTAQGFRSPQRDFYRYLRLRSSDAGDSSIEKSRKAENGMCQVHLLQFTHNGVHAYLVAL